MYGRVENNGGSTGGVTGRGFVKGRSGNPGGRPKGLARKVREVLGDDGGDALVCFWVAVMRGELTSTNDAGEEVVERVELRDRIAVSKLLAERGWGKPTEFVPLENGDPLQMSEDKITEIAAEFDRKLDEIAARRAQTRRQLTGI
jgi:hypothetical protein